MEHSTHGLIYLAIREFLDQPDGENPAHLAGKVLSW